MTTETPATATTPTTPDNSYFKQLDLCDLIFKQPWLVFRQNAVCFLTIALFASGLRVLLAFVFDMVNGPYGADYGTSADVSGYYNVDYNTNQLFGKTHTLPPRYERRQLNSKSTKYREKYITKLAELHKRLFEK